MPWYKRLRYRLIGSQLVVVFVGVLTMLLVTRYYLPRRLTALIHARLTPLNIDPEILALVETDLVQSADRLFLSALLVAASAALVVGLVYGVVMWLIIITPLREMALSSQRIANGRYDERVDIPTEAGEAMATLATNFNQMASTLERVEETRITLIGNVTHELRTPLTSLSGYVEGLNDGIFTPGEKVFRSMHRQIQRLTRLIDDIQTLSRAESGSIAFDLLPIDTQELIQQILFQLTPQLMAKEIEIISHFPDQPLMILADYDRTAQIITNLISNSIRYTDQSGKIRVNVSSESLPDGTQVGRIDIIDSGVGIDQAALAMIFERFYRVDRSRSRDSAQGGSGVGLTISRHLARGMQGDLTAKSDGPGKGATFTLTLPQIQRI